MGFFGDLLEDVAEGIKKFPADVERYKMELAHKSDSELMRIARTGSPQSRKIAARYILTGRGYSFRKD